MLPNVKTTFEVVSHFELIVIYTFIMLPTSETRAVLCYSFYVGGMVRDGCNILLASCQLL